MPVPKHRRMSDITFTIDSSLRVIGANRNFLQLFDMPGVDFSLSDYMDSTAQKNLSYFLGNFNSKSKNRYFVVNMTPRGNPQDFLLSIRKEKEGFVVRLMEFNFSQEIFDKALLENREFCALLNKIDAYFFVYDGKKCVLRNTRNLEDIYSASLTTFKKYLLEFFNITRSEAGKLDALFDDVRQEKTNLVYTFETADNVPFSIHTARSSTRNTSVSIGFIAHGSKFMVTDGATSDKRDGLTDLYNKQTITDMARQRIGSGREVSLFVIDIDKFKEYNDLYGHAFGDKVIVTVANVLKESMDNCGIAGRIGGDEFLCIVDRTKEEDVREVARSIKLGIQWAIPAINPETVVTCSIGISRCPLNASTYDEMFSLADKCLYIAKNKGRNCYIIYKPELHNTLLVKQEENAHEIASGSSYISEMQEQMAILNAAHDMKAQIPQVLELLKSYLNVSSVSVYHSKTGEHSDFSPYCMVNEDKADLRKDAVNDSGYFKYYNDYEFYLLNNTNMLDTLDKKAYAIYMDNKISSALELICENSNKSTRTLFCFDVYKAPRTFSTTKVIFVLMIAKILAERISAELNPAIAS